MLNPDYRDMLSALSDAEAEYILVGAFALAVHGNPRSTGDIDILVRPTQQNADRVMKALRAFGAPLSDVALTDLVTPGTVIQFGVAPRRIDILTSVDGFDTWEEVLQDHLIANIDGLQVPVMGRKALIRNKSSVGRPQDLVDVAWLESQTDPD